MAKEEAGEERKSQPSKEAAPPQQPKLVAPPGLRSSYANLVRIAHSPSELVFDFAQLLPGHVSAPVQARVLMSPLSAKLFHRALSENLAKYENTYGEIVLPKKPSSLADYLFRAAQNPDNEENEESDEDG